MKKKIIISIILLIVIVPITINKIDKEENNSYTIETYIDGKLAASLPSSGSGYIVDNITCTNGASGTFNYSTWRVEVSNITSNTKCTVKFKSSNNTSFANYLINKKCTIDKATIEGEQAKDCLINEEETGDTSKNYRYEGINPNNYVLFNDELWRIIGVFNVETANGKQDLVKLIRAEVLDGLAWNSTNTNTWEGGSLEKSLNEKYINAIDDSECYIYSTTVKKTCYFSETGIKSGAREKIEAVKWNIGPSDNAATAAAVYTNEKGTQTDYYKVGLMSASDYGFAVLAKYCSRSTNLVSYNTDGCAGQDWIKSTEGEWPLTGYSKGATQVLTVHGRGDVDAQSSNVGWVFRPSVYLKSTVQYVGGSGTYSDPYVIA